MKHVIGNKPDNQFTGYYLIIDCVEIEPGKFAYGINWVTMTIDEGSGGGYSYEFFPRRKFDTEKECVIAACAEGGTIIKTNLEIQKQSYSNGHINRVEKLLEQITEYSKSQSRPQYIQLELF